MEIGNPERGNFCRTRGRKSNILTFSRTTVKGKKIQDFSLERAILPKLRV
jgi:hypothetical protein